MNILPSIDNSKKKFRFSNPLSGTVYNNNHYLKHCHYEADPQMINSIKKRKKHQKVNSFVIQNQSMNRLSSPSSRKKQSSISKMRNEQLNRLFENSETKYIEKYHRSSEKNIFKFPDVQVKIIDQIQCLKDFFQKILKVNLQHYFGMFFRKSLAGSFTSELVNIVEKYISILVQENKLDSVVQTKDYPSEYFSLKSKRSFLQKIQELESKNNFSAVIEMVKYYCIPSKQFRQSCFRDIIHMLSQSLYEKFNLSKENNYLILTQNGKKIEEICEIKFSTTVFLISTRETYEKSFAKYNNIIQSDLLNFQKLSFNENMKKNFRNIIMKGKIDQIGLINQNEIKRQDSKQKRKLAESKILERRNSGKSLKKLFSPAKTTTNFIFNKSGQKKDNHKRSKSSLAQSKTLMLKLSDTKVTSMNARKRYQFYDQMFEKLQTFNAVYDISYNYSVTDKLLIIVLKKQFQLFRSKSNEQVDAILKAFKINPSDESITKQQFYTINEVIRCKGDHTHIVEFVSKYLPFNEYGELQKVDLQKTLKFVLNDEAGEEVVLNIIWSWLQKNSLIENGVLVRNTLQSWYEKNKMAFVIMVSFIFGTNQNSWVDMAYEVLV